MTRSTSRTLDSGCGGPESRSYIEAPGLGLELYSDVAELPIVSPHGHIDVRLFADPEARLDPPGRLFVGADHYVVRMLYSQGVPLERAGLGDAEVDDRAVWQLLADNVHLFALTPTGLWLRETLATVFGIEERLDSATAELLTRGSRSSWRCLRSHPARCSTGFGWSPCRRPTRPVRRLQTIAPSRRGKRAGRPTFRPDAVVALDAAGWREALSELGLWPTARSSTTRRSSRCWPSAAPRSRHSADGTDDAATSADTSRLTDREASALFANALAGESPPGDARRFEAHMLNELRG